MGVSSEKGNQRSKCKRMFLLDVATTSQAAKKISKHVVTRKLIRSKLEQKQLESDVAELGSKKRDVRSDKEPEVEQRKLDADKVPHVQGSKFIRFEKIHYNGKTLEAFKSAKSVFFPGASSVLTGATKLPTPGSGYNE